MKIWCYECAQANNQPDYKVFAYQGHGIVVTAIPAGVWTFCGRSVKLEIE